MKIKESLAANSLLSTRRFTAALAFAAAGLIATSASAALVVTVGNVNVTPGQTSVVVPVTVTGGDLVSDGTFVLQVGDGGTVTNHAQVPEVSAFDLSTSIFNGLPSGYTTSSAFGPSDEIVDLQIVATTAGQSVAAQGTLLKFTLDLTVGQFVAGSQYALSLTDSFGTTTRLTGPNGATYATTLTGGTLSVVPEPTAIASVGLLALLGRRRRA